MAKEKQHKGKLCFIVGPIGDEDSDDRIHADWLLEEIIQPVFETGFPDFKVERADKISEPGRIDAQVISALLEADLVIADLTTLNPNAFYEIGIRHMVQKPIIHMHLEGQRIPFDIASFRSIRFSRERPKDLRRARELLRAAVNSATSEKHDVDNPVTFARGKMQLENSATPAEKVIEKELRALQTKMQNFERRTNIILHGDYTVLDALRSPKRSSRFDSSLSSLFVSASSSPADDSLLSMIEFRIRASALASPRQLHEFVEKYLPAYFESFVYRNRSENEITLAVSDIERNRSALLLLSQEGEEHEPPIHVVVA